MPVVLKDELSLEFLQRKGKKCWKIKPIYSKSNQNKKKAE